MSEENPARNARRRIFYLGWHPQGWLLANFLSLTGLAALIVLGDYYYYYGRSMASNLMDPGLFRLFLTQNPGLSVKMLFFLLFAVAVGLRLSHRVSGPLHSLKQSMRRVGEGRLDHRARVRKEDVVPDLIEEFNRMTAQIADGLRRDQATLREAVAAMDRIAPAIADPASRRALEDVLQALRGVGHRFSL